MSECVTLGEPDGRPLLLLIRWDDEVCRLLLERGFYVVRYDNRDAGRTKRSRTQDAISLLDHLGINRAHVVGGMIAQLLAIRFTERVESLVLIRTGGVRTRALRQLRLPAAVVQNTDGPAQPWPDLVDVIDRTAGRAEEFAAGTLIGGEEFELESA